VKKNDVVVVSGEKVTLQAITTSKTGKHGSSKLHITGTTSTGKKVELLVPSSSQLEKIGTTLTCPC